MARRGPLSLGRGNAFSANPEAQQRCQSHEHDTCTIAASSTCPWQTLHTPPPSPPIPLAGPVEPRPPSSVGIAPSAAVIASATKSLLCSHSVRLSASPVKVVARHAGQRKVRSSYHANCHVARYTEAMREAVQMNEWIRPSFVTRAALFLSVLTGLPPLSAGVGDADCAIGGGGSGVNAGPERNSSCVTERVGGDGIVSCYCAGPSPLLFVIRSTK